MNMNEKSIRGESGQALIIMVFGMIALLIVAGLAIDGGTAFMERRHVQNAADAASLAGARRLAEAMCSADSPDAADAAIYAEVISYADRNGVKDASGVTAAYVKFDEDRTVVGFSPPVMVGGGTVPQGASGVSATVTLTRSTLFMSLIGIDTAGASAAAAAVTGPPLYLSGGIRPFGIPLDVVQELKKDDCFDISFGQHCDDTHADCTIEYLDGRTSSHRGWMNMNYVWNQGDESRDWYRAVSQNPGGTLDDWMKDGWDGSLWADCKWSEGCRWGDFIHAKPGTEQDALNVAPIGESITVPIFDTFPDCDGMAPDLQAPWPTPPDAPKDACTGMAGADYYHIVGFAQVKVEDMEKSSHSLELCVEEIIVGEGRPAPNMGYGSDVCATHMMVVTLWQ
jgi:Flp pilus assembly protein TadG